MKLRRNTTRQPNPALRAIDNDPSEPGCIKLEHVTKTYLMGPAKVQALSDVSIQIDGGQFVVTRAERVGQDDAVEPHRRH